SDTFGYTIRNTAGQTDDGIVTVIVEPRCPPGRFTDTLEPAAKPGWTVQTAANGEGSLLSPNWTVVSDGGAKSATHSWSSDSTTLDSKDDRLIAPAQVITPLSKLTFWHRFRFEPSFDGGVLEVSTNGGATWADLTTKGSFAEGGYTGTIDPTTDSAIAGRNAWTAGFVDARTAPMTKVVANLGGFVPTGAASATVLVRFRLVADALALGSLPGDSWWIDDVDFTGLYSHCNRAPIAGDDSAATREGVAVTVNVLTNDSDPDGDAIHVAVVYPPANGTATLNADETITYTPAAGFSGTDTFDYDISDPEGATDTGTVTVTVRANNAPVARDDTANTEQGTAVNVDVLANDSD
ncbi:MAG: Ig-like domain-containing protein, partial [Mycobacteriales bacterium]